jgi:hypothetical protein
VVLAEDYRQIVIKDRCTDFDLHACLIEKGFLVWRRSLSARKCWRRSAWPSNLTSSHPGRDGFDVDLPIVDNPQLTAGG